MVVVCVFPYLPTTEQTVAVLTKGLPKVQFDRMIDKLTMKNIFKQAYCVDAL